MRSWVVLCITLLVSTTAHAERFANLFFSNMNEQEGHFKTHPLSPETIDLEFSQAWSHANNGAGMKALLELMKNAGKHNLVLPVDVEVNASHQITQIVVIPSRLKHLPSAPDLTFNSNGLNAFQSDAIDSLDSKLPTVEKAEVAELIYMVEAGSDAQGPYLMVKDSPNGAARRMNLKPEDWNRQFDNGMTPLKSLSEINRYAAKLLIPISLELDANHWVEQVHLRPDLVSSLNYMVSYNREGTQAWIYPDGGGAPVKGIYSSIATASLKVFPAQLPQTQRLEFSTPMTGKKYFLVNINMIPSPVTGRPVATLVAKTDLTSPQLTYFELDPQWTKNHNQVFELLKKARDISKIKMVPMEALAAQGSTLLEGIRIRIDWASDAPIQKGQAHAISFYSNGSQSTWTCPEGMCMMSGIRENALDGLKHTLPNKAKYYFYKFVRIGPEGKKRLAVLLKTNPLSSTYTTHPLGQNWDDVKMNAKANEPYLGTAVTNQSIKDADEAMEAIKKIGNIANRDGKAWLVPVDPQFEEVNGEQLLRRMNIDLGQISDLQTTISVTPDAAFALQHSKFAGEPKIEINLETAFESLQKHAPLACDGLY